MKQTGRFGCLLVICSTCFIARAAESPLPQAAPAAVIDAQTAERYHTDGLRCANAQDFPRARALLEEESVLRAIDPEQLEAMEAWLARADALRMRVEALEPSDPILAADLELVEGDAGARERVEARLSLLRRVLAESTEQDERAWAEAIEEIADPARSPGYDGLVLDPHLALVPLGREPVSGLWVFADRRTGPVPERDGDGALILLLHPGSRDEGVPPFLIAASELLPSHLEYAGVGSEWSELGYLAPTPAQARLVGVLSRPILPAPVR